MARYPCKVYDKQGRLKKVIKAENQKSPWESGGNTFNTSRLELTDSEKAERLADYIPKDQYYSVTKWRKDHED